MVRAGECRIGHTTDRNVHRTFNLKSERSGATRSTAEQFRVNQRNAKFRQPISQLPGNNLVLRSTRFESIDGHQIFKGTDGFQLFLRKIDYASPASQQINLHQMRGTLQRRIPLAKIFVCALAPASY